MATTRISSSTANYILIDPLTWNKQIISMNGNLNAATLSGGSPSGSSLLIIYKGTPETFPSFTDRATRASDVLITFSLGVQTASYTSIGDVGGTHVRVVIGKCLTLTSATASGLASWFLLCRAGTTTLADKGALIGTVGLVGTGADLEISSTNVVSGNYYTSSGLYINIPYNWTL